MKKIIALFALLLAALALVACGSGSSSSSEETGAVAGAAQEAEEKAEEVGEEAEEGAEEAKEKAEETKQEAESGSSGSTVEVEADPSGNLAFTSEEITAKAGKDTIEFTNESPVPHDVKIEDSSGKEIGGTEITSEGSDTAEVDLKPGTYTYFCSVPGHRQAGMEGTLVVK